MPPESVQPPPALSHPAPEPAAAGPKVRPEVGHRAHRQGRRVRPAGRRRGRRGSESRPPSNRVARACPDRRRRSPAAWRRSGRDAGSPGAVRPHGRHCRRSARWGSALARARSACSRAALAAGHRWLQRCGGHRPEPRRAARCRQAGSPPARSGEAAGRYPLSPAPRSVPAAVLRAARRERHRRSSRHRRAGSVWRSRRGACRPRRSPRRHPTPPRPRSGSCAPSPRRLAPNLRYPP